MSSLNSSEDGGRRVAVCLQQEAGGVEVSWRWRAGGALDMEVSLTTGDCSNVGITYTTLLFTNENIYFENYYDEQRKLERIFSL